MSTDREYRIRIQTEGDPSGAQQVAAALDKTTGATQEATKATEKHGAGLHSLHKIFHALNEVVPGLGVLMQAAFSPIGAAISIAVLALRTFQEHTRKVNEEFKRMEEEAAKPLTKRLEAMRESVVSGAVGMDALHDRLAEAARGQQTLAAETDRAVAAMREQVGVVEALGAAQESGELAFLENLHSAGLLSEEQYVEQKLAIEQAYVEKKRALEERQEMTEILIRRRALERANLEHPGLQSQAESAGRKKEKALEDLASYDKPGIDERYKETKKKLKEFEDGKGSFLGPDRNTEVGWFEQAGGAYGTHESLNETIRKLGRPGYSGDQFGNFDTWQGLKWDADRAEKDWKKAPGEEARLKVAAAAASRDEERAAQQAFDSTKFATDAARDLEERQRRLRDRQQANEDLSQTERTTNKLKTPIGGLATKDAAEAEATGLAIEHRKPVSRESEEQLREVGTAIAGHQVSLQTAVQMMHWARQNNLWSQNSVASLICRHLQQSRGFMLDHFVRSATSVALAAF